MSTAQPAAQAASGGRFDELTAIEHVGGPARAHIAPEVTGFSGAHGGYVAAIAARAMTEPVTSDRPLRTLSIQLLAPARPGAVELHTRVERDGRATSATSARIDQAGDPVATALAILGRSTAGPRHDDGHMPDVPAPDECKPLVIKPVPDARAGLLVEHRPAGPLPLSGGDRAEILVWMRLVEDRSLDELLLCFLADSAPPGLYGSLHEFVAMPSILITLHFAHPAERLDSPWVLGAIRNRVASEGYATEDGELWTPDGQLLLHSRQLRRVLPKA